MLGSRTKQVNSYGKRSLRVVADDGGRTGKGASIFDDVTPQWKPVASRMKRRENTIPAKKSPPRAVGQQTRKKKLSPLRVQVAKKLARISDPRTPVKHVAQVLLDASPSLRTPLAVYSSNIPASPALLGPRLSIKPATVKPLVQLDIITLDDEGHTVKTESRVSRPKDSSSSESSPADGAAPTKRRKRLLRRTGVKLVVISDDESDDASSDSYAPSEADSQPSPPQPLPKPSKKSPKKRVPRRRIVSDDFDSDATPTDSGAVVPPRPPSPAPAPAPIPTKRQRSKSPPPAQRRVSRVDAAPVKPRRRSPSPEPYATTMQSLLSRYQYDSWPRQATPIRGGRKPLFQPPSPPSPTTPSDLGFDFDDIEFIDGPTSKPAEVPEYIKPLLEECNQSSCGIVDFSSFIGTFPFDPVVRTKPGQDLSFRKIGEASYSEVFGIGNVVLKIIPIRDEDPTSGQRATRQSFHVNAEEEPFPTDAKDVLKELIVTRAMGQVCDGFVKLLKSYVVRGRYPQLLLEQWDEYYRRKGSESIRPDTFTLSQVYCIIVLPNGGPDLEAFTLPNPSKTGWRQVCSIFWQVAKALAHAEKLVSFEHRDLHLGQILVETHDTAPPTRPFQEQSQNKPPTKIRKLKMDDSAHGVTVTLIDLGLARMDAGDGSGGEMVHWTPFDQEIFDGEGDYQFDIYRMMRSYNGGKWQNFNPITNVMWLHYLLIKLMGFKGLKTPMQSRKKSTATPAALASATASSNLFTDKECYECLVDLEDWLGRCLTAVVPPDGKAKGKKKAQNSQFGSSISPVCAGEVVEYGVKKRWVKAIS